MTSIKEQVVRELHKPARKNFKRRSVIVKGIDDLWQADLIELIPYAKVNSGYRYILAVIDCFSKFAWVRPCRRKNDREVSKAFKSVLKEGRTPKHLQTDRGNEFYNSKFKYLMKSSNNIKHYSTYSNMKASICERFIRTFKNKLWQKFSLQGSYKWVDALPSLVREYNSTLHRTIGMKPCEVKGRTIEKRLLDTVYVKSSVTYKPKFNVGDFVRISKFKAAFAKGYTPSWSTEIFKVKQIKRTNPVTYLVQDDSGQEIAGGFYEQELQIVKYPDVYLVEKVLKKKKGGKVLVKWLGLDSKRNSWIDQKDLNI